MGNFFRFMNDLFTFRVLGIIEGFRHAKKENDSVMEVATTEEQESRRTEAFCSWYDLLTCSYLHTQSSSSRLTSWLFSSQSTFIYVFLLSLPCVLLFLTTKNSYIPHQLC